MLGGFRLEFLGGGDPGDEGDVDEDAVLATNLMPNLADGFEERERFNVADGATDFTDDDIDISGELLDGCLDLVGDVRDHLDGLAEIVTAALALNDLLVDATAGEVVGPGEVGVGVALVVAKVEVGFGTIVGDEDFPVLVGTHGPGIDIEIGVELLESYFKSPVFKKTADGGGCDPLAEGGDDAAGDEDVFCHLVGTA